MSNGPENYESTGIRADQPGPATPMYGSYPAAPPPKPSTNGLAIVGLILAFLLAPVGFILSLVGLVQAGRRRQKGKGLAIVGIIVSLVLMGVGGVILVAAGNKVATLADPGCTTGKAAILDNATRAAGADQATMKQGLQATIDGLNSAVAKAQHDNVRTAMKTLADDYSKLLQAVTTATAPDANLMTKISEDANAIDNLCSIGGAK